MEDNIDISKGFWVDGLKVVDKDGNFDGHSLSSYQGRIKVSLGKPKKDYDKHVMTFKTVLPNHIVDKLREVQEIERSRGGLNAKVEKRRYTDMKKTVVADSLESLVNKYNYITEDYLFIIRNEKKPKEKIIFINFKSNFNDGRKSYWNSSLMGKEMSLEYHYFVGYYNGQSYYDMEHRSINHHQDKFMENYKRIPWTQEREDFFDGVYDNFEKFKGKLESFFESLTSKNIDSHISNFKLLA